jgi:hypothetical protein
MLKIYTERHFEIFVTKDTSPIIMTKYKRKNAKIEAKGFINVIVKQIVS